MLGATAGLRAQVPLQLSASFTPVDDHRVECADEDWRYRRIAAVHVAADPDGKLPPGLKLNPARGTIAGIADHDRALTALQ